MNDIVINSKGLPDDLVSFVVTVRPWLGGYQAILRFPNNYGASVVSNPYSYGLELAVIVFSGENYELTYDTPITNDVLGRLDAESLTNTLRQIKELKKGVSGNTQNTFQIG